MCFSDWCISYKTLTLTKHNCDAAQVFILLLRLTYEIVLNFISCWQLVGLGGLHREADDLIGLFDLGQCHLGHGWQVLEAGVKKGIGGMTRERRSDLSEEKRTVIHWGICIYAPTITWGQANPPVWFCPVELSQSWERKMWSRCQFLHRMGRAPVTRFLSSGPHHRGQRCPRRQTSRGLERSAQ